MTSIKICAPSRIYGAHTKGSFSTSAMIDYMSELGFDGVDMSFENISSLDDYHRSVLYAAKNRAKARGLDIPCCHLPFYMPDPHDRAKMERFSADIMAGIDAAAIMEIPLCVIHPIAIHQKRESASVWADMNLRFLTPICKYAYKKGVKLCIENMASSCEEDGDHLFGSTAAEVLALAEALDTGVCWDFGHASISGRPTDDPVILGERLLLVHAHDNNAIRDAHMIPFDGEIDWEGAMGALAAIGYRGYISIEARAWDIPPDDRTRQTFGRRVLSSGRRLSRLCEQ